MFNKDFIGFGIFPLYQFSIKRETYTSFPSLFKTFKQNDLIGYYNTIKKYDFQFAVKFQYRDLDTFIHPLLRIKKIQYVKQKKNRCNKTSDPNDFNTDI